MASEAGFLLFIKICFKEMRGVLYNELFDYQFITGNLIHPLLMVKLKYESTNLFGGKKL